jgi:sugar lactone lactonase YvrE
MRTPRFVAVTALLSLLGVVSTGLVGCGGTNAPAVTTPTGPTAKNLFEWDYTNNTLNEFSLSASGTATATAMMALPSNFSLYNLAQDASGKVYLGGNNTTTNSPEILVFAAGATSFTTPVATINPAAEVDYMAVDSAGNVYVNDSESTYYEYSPTGSLLRTLTETTAIYGEGMALDTAGNLFLLGYTATNAGLIDVVPANATSGNIVPSRTLTFPTVSGGNFPVSLALDGTGNLYVGIQFASYTGISSIEVFNATATVASPTRTIMMPAQPAGFNQEINDVAVDSAGYVYIQVEDYNPPSNNVITNPFYGFAPGATTPAVNFNVSGNPYGYFYIR